MGETKNRSVTVRETDDGMIIEIKGDKENMQRKKEAIEAFFEFRDKFWEAFGPKSGPLAEMHKRHHEHHHWHHGASGVTEGDEEVEKE
ncbi:MAG: hypothetical protein ACYC6V_07205 [Bacillota bacterium]